MKAAVDGTVERLGGIDVLVCNAGVVHISAVETMTEEAWDLTMDVNVKGVFLACKAALPHLKQRPGSCIINVASVAAFIPRSTYAASKLWLISFSRWANAEYRDNGIVVTAVCPGFTHTEFHQRLGLPVGKEGVPGWMWLNAPYVVAASLRDVEKGKALSVPSVRYKALAALSRVAPAGLTARIGRRGR